MKVVSTPRPMASADTKLPPTASTSATAANDTHSSNAEMELSKKMVPLTALRYSALVLPKRSLLRRSRRNICTTSSPWRFSCRSALSWLSSSRTR